MNQRFAELAKSIQPPEMEQWFRYTIEITIQNTDNDTLTLNNDTQLVIGHRTNHSLRTQLDGDVTIRPGESAVLAFDRARVCAQLPAGDYEPVLLLCGVTSDQSLFCETLACVDNVVAVQDARESPANSIGLAASWRFVIAASAVMAKETFIVRNREDVYADDAWLAWQHGSDHFDVLSDPHTYMPPRLLVPDLLGDRQVSLHFRPRAGLELDTVYDIGVLLAKRLTIGCPHSGLQTGMGAGGHIRAVVAENANAEITCVTPSSLGIQFDSEFDIYVSVRNPKPFETSVYRDYGVAAAGPVQQMPWEEVPERRVPTRPIEFLPGIEGITNSSPAPPETKLTFWLDGADVSHLFTIESIAGTVEIAPGKSGIIGFHVTCDRTVPREKLIRVVPTIATYVWSHNDQTRWHRLFGSVQGAAASNDTSCVINIRQ